MFVSRNEIIRYALRLIPQSITLLFIHTYTFIIFLIMYTLMWSLSISFDMQFFTLAVCILNYLWFSLYNVSRGVQHFVNYLTAVKRIQVRFYIVYFHIFIDVYFFIEFSSVERVWDRSTTIIHDRWTWMW